MFPLRDRRQWAALAGTLQFAFAAGWCIARLSEGEFFKAALAITLGTIWAMVVWIITLHADAGEAGNHNYFRP